MLNHPPWDIMKPKLGITHTWVLTGQHGAEHRAGHTADVSVRQATWALAQPLMQVPLRGGQWAPSESPFEAVCYMFTEMKGMEEPVLTIAHLSSLTS